MMKKTGLFILATTISLVGCKNPGNQEKNNTEMATENVETSNNETPNEWTSLSNGENLEGWKAYNAAEISEQWQVTDGAIVFTPSENVEGSENLITEEEYTNFELTLDWKISENGNSGIMWGVQENEELSEPYYTGPEIQVLDNEGHPDAKNGPVRQAGALYDMVPPNEDVTNPAGQWNTMTLKIDHEANKGSVILNGTKINEFPVHGEEWNNMVADSKFADWEHFGKSRTGHIALQDHGNKVSYRNIKIRRLE